MTGKQAGYIVFLPSIFAVIMPSDYALLFILKCHQFPIRFAFVMAINKAQDQTLFSKRPVFNSFHTRTAGVLTDKAVVLQTMLCIKCCTE